MTDVTLVAYFNS